MSQFSKVLIMGTGRLPIDCARTILTKRKIAIEIYDCDETPGILKRRAEASGIPYFHLAKRELIAKLEEVNEPSLLISALNPYILPERIFENLNITAVNCHRALLPRHPGRNAEMWAIYDEDGCTGITWHWMTKEIDAGSILVQKSFPLTESITAHEVMHQQILSAGEGFAEICDGLFEGTLTSWKQEKNENWNMHYSWDRPNDSVLDPLWPTHKISAFLRSMDYGVLPITKPPRLVWSGKVYFWKKYMLSKEKRMAEGIYIEEDTIYIQKSEMLVELIGYFEEDALLLD